jgi:hypothetical protein
MLHIKIVLHDDETDETFSEPLLAPESGIYHPADWATGLEDLGYLSGRIDPLNELTNILESLVEGLTPESPDVGIEDYGNDEAAFSTALMENDESADFDLDGGWEDDMYIEELIADGLIDVVTNDEEVVQG